MIAALLRTLLHIKLIPNCTQASMHRVSIKYAAIIIITWDTSVSYHWQARADRGGCLGVGVLKHQLSICFSFGLLEEQYYQLYKFWVSTMQQELNTI